MSDEVIMGKVSEEKKIPEVEINPEEETVKVGGVPIKLPPKFWKYFGIGVAIAGIIAGIWYGTGA